MLSHVYFGALIEMTAIPKSTLGRGKSHKCFKICDEYCRQKGSCLLWVMSTEISVDIVVNIAVDSRSIVGRQSVDIRSIVGR